VPQREVTESLFHQHCRCPLNVGDQDQKIEVFVPPAWGITASQVNITRRS
jgi:hypothetical protein